MRIFAAKIQKKKTERTFENANQRYFLYKNHTFFYKNERSFENIALPLRRVQQFGRK